MEPLLNASLGTGRHSGPENSLVVCTAEHWRELNGTRFRQLITRRSRVHIPAPASQEDPGTDWVLLVNLLLILCVDGYIGDVAR
ncbi:hypothetical protein BH23ACT5_BH23ACT5_12460 [soil metagenome]